MFLICCYLSALLGNKKQLKILSPMIGPPHKIFSAMIGPRLISYSQHTVHIAHLVIFIPHRKTYERYAPENIAKDLIKKNSLLLITTKARPKIY